MPLYEYECEDCQRQFEVFQGFDAQPPGHCEYCSSRKVRRIISRPAILFKGSGFHVTDYTRTSGQHASTADSAGNGKEKKGSDTGPKPAGGSDAAPSPPKADSSQKN